MIKTFISEKLTEFFQKLYKYKENNSIFGMD